MFVSPFKNHNNSTIIERRCTFFVVTSGNPLDKSKRIWCPKIEVVPVPVLSPLKVPSSKIRRSKSWYCCILKSRLFRHRRYELPLRVWFEFCSISEEDIHISGFLILFCEWNEFKQMKNNLYFRQQKRTMNYECTFDCTPFSFHVYGKWRVDPDPAKKY